MYPSIDIPFQNRHQCWFCGEPKYKNLNIPKASDNSHPSLDLPSCKECLYIANKHTSLNLWDVQSQIKQTLIKRYHKHLAIGVNWTEQELKDSEFEGKALEGFRISGWKMFEIARDRVNYKGWPLSLDGVKLVNQQAPGFSFDGVEYPSLISAVDHFCKARHLDKSFLNKIIKKIGPKRFGFAIRLATIHIMATNEMKKQVLQEL